ncbi:MAG: serine/threonine-protein kinase [Polyangiaceae bacterium]
MVDRFSMPPVSLSGMVIQSDLQPGVSYRIEKPIGEGGLGTAYLALRQAADGMSPVVVKVVRGSSQVGNISPDILVKKEAVALGRLNERVPPTPFVVRFIDTGTSRMFDDTPMPWLALEYVHGGVEGTTLEDRVLYSIHRTKFAFDPTRTAHLLRCMAAGLSAIHAVGVVHRDITPGNVLCCGFGEGEIFKISDFGVARPQGLAATFGGMGVGTAGYAAPEQSLPESSTAGPFTDVFGLACVIFYAITGEHYFDCTSPVQAYGLVRDRKRRSITECVTLSPEFLERPEACRNIDGVLARATSFASDQRPQTGPDLAASLGPWLADPSSAPRPSRRLVNSLLNLSPPGDLSKWTWTTRHPPGDNVVIQSAAWDADGRCFVFTPRGPLFWNGQSWLDAPEVAHSLPAGMTFARRYEAGGWLVGGAGGALAVYNTQGVREVVHAPDATLEFSHASGRFDDLVVAVGQRPDEAPSLWAMAARRWMKPLRLDGISYVAALHRLDESRWLLCGRLAAGTGFAAIYTPMQWEVEYLEVPHTRAFVGGASEPERGVALLVGADGVALRVGNTGVVSTVAHGAADLTAAAMDVLAREWVASLGTLWVRDAEREMDWQRVWSVAEWHTPFISLMADAGMVVAMTVDGGIVEGRAAWHALRGRSSSTPPRR